MHGGKTVARCAIGVVGQATASRTAIALGTAATAHAVAMTVLTVFAPTTFAMSLKIVRSTPLTLTSNAVTVPLLTMTSTSKGH